MNKTEWKTMVHHELELHMLCDVTMDVVDTTQK